MKKTILILAAGFFIFNCASYDNITRSKNVSKGSIAIIGSEELPFSVVSQGGGGFGLMGALAEEGHRQELEKFYKDQLPGVEKVNYESEIENDLIAGFSQDNGFTANVNNSYKNPAWSEYAKKYSFYNSGKYKKDIKEKRKNIASDYILEYRIIMQNISLVSFSYYANFFIVYTMYDKDSHVVWQFQDYENQQIAGPYQGEKKSPPNNLLEIFENYEKNSVKKALDHFFSKK